MLSQKFFDDVAADVAAHEKTAQARKAAANTARDFQGSVVDDVYPIAVDAQNRLAPAITATVKRNALGVEFMLEYLDGGSRNLVIGPGPVSGSVRFTENLGDATSLSGSNFYTSATWNPAVYEEELRKFIASFVAGISTYGRPR